MTLAFGTQKHEGGPKTHVLAIGVGRYAHLTGGKEAHLEGIPPLGQLKSPPVSTRVLADWFLSRTHPNPDVPLGSIELLISDANSQKYTRKDNGDVIVVEDSTMANIERAFNDWDARCNANPDNIAIFYFCGHGLQKDAMVLLPEDFAQNPNNPWLRAIDFDRTYRGMAQCAAQTQYYVIDACRQYTTSMLQDLDVEGQTLKRAIIGKQKPRTAPKLFASANGLPAFGDSGDVSRLTDALLKCLNGGGADKRGGKWLIDTDHLGGAVKKLIDLNNTNLLPEDRQCVDPAIDDNSAGTRVLHELAKGEVPEVFVAFYCDPDSATQRGRFYLQRQGNMQQAPEPGRWISRLPAGVYDFGVKFSNGGYAEAIMTEEFIRPPVWPVTLITKEV